MLTLFPFSLRLAIISVSPWLHSSASLLRLNHFRCFCFLGVCRPDAIRRYRTYRIGNLLKLSPFSMGNLTLSTVASWPAICSTAARRRDCLLSVVRVPQTCLIDRWKPPCTESENVVGNAKFAERTDGSGRGTPSAMKRITLVYGLQRFAWWSSSKICREKCPMWNELNCKVTATHYNLPTIFILIFASLLLFPLPKIARLSVSTPRRNNSIKECQNASRFIQLCAECAARQKKSRKLRRKQHNRKY